MFDLELTQLIIVVTCAMLIGFSKTGLPALGILVVAVMASIFPARYSIGIVLPLLIIADIVAVTYYRRSVVWRTLFSLLPWVLGGILGGYALLHFVQSSEYIEIILGSIILSLVILQIAREKWGTAWLDALPTSTWFVAVMGTLAGFTTMIGNAAGPIMAIFLLAIALPKKAFIGTGAWFFLTVNLIKVPLYVNLGLITSETLSFNLWFIPAILVGTFLGIKLIPYIPQKLFNMLILFIAAVAGLRLILF